MPRPSQADQQRKNLLPIVCRVFSQRGYRRTTTAEMARQCKVRENILYRLWADKKAMFLAAIDDIFERRAAAWQTLLADRPPAREAGQRLVAYEAEHQGEFGFYRVVFTALAETDDADIRAALVRMYRRFHEIVLGRVKAGRQGRPRRPGLPADFASWALIGLATVSNVIRELDLLKPRQRERMFAAVAQWLGR
jgi:TetR/AcrR family transcriptional repressor of nem operon